MKTQALTAFEVEKIWKDSAIFQNLALKGLGGAFMFKGIWGWDNLQVNHVLFYRDLHIEFSNLR